MKSVSTLWAVADPAVATLIEQAHQAAVKDALAFIEKHALFTRTGPQEIRQVNVRGLIAAAFTHRDSRAGDLDLHTHVAVANKVQTLDGRWLSIDGRVLFKANVAASETYNTALEQRLREALGVRFTERPGTDPAKRLIREIVGVDPRLNQRWSTRRAHIEARRGELAIQFQNDHGRPPTPVEALHLAQQATLETRDAKHEPRSLAEQRVTWLNEAAAVLGSSEAVAWMVRTVLAPPAETATIVDVRWVSQMASRVLAIVEESRSTWQMWHVRAEAQRQVRTIDVPAEHAAALVDLLVHEVLHSRSVALGLPNDDIDEPEPLRRVDGSSVYTVAGADLYTSQRILDAERRLLAAAGRRDGSAVDQVAVDRALLEMAANGTALDAGQASLVWQMCSSGARVQLAIAPAGAGKTTAMRALTLAWTQDGGQVLGLAPSAAAAAVLGEQTGIRTDTLAKLTWSLQHGDLPEWPAAVGPSTLVIIDEAGMADTLSLDTAIQFAIARGASVRLVGDDQQLAAIGAGGVLRDITNTHGALRLTELHRFTDPAEAAASLALRDGDPEALEFYLDHGRVHIGDLATTVEDAFNAWVSDRAAGLDTIMIAPTRHLVAELNARARAHRLDHSPAVSEVSLADGNRASVGDVIITRTNDRRLRLTATDWVKNGDRWTVTHVSKQGDLRVRHTRSHLTVRLSADYVRESTGLGYATTIHSAQGVTADTMHSLATGQESRQQLYTMSPAAGQPTTFTCRSSATATRTPSSDPKRSPPALRPRPCSISSLVTRPPPQQPRCCENSATRLPGCSTPFSATPTGSMSQPSSWLPPSSFRCSIAKPTRSSANSPANRPGRRSEHICSLWRLRPVSTHSSTCRQPPPDENSTPPKTWPPCSTGASQSPHPLTQDRFPGFPEFRMRSAQLSQGFIDRFSGSFVLCKDPPVLPFERDCTLGDSRYVLSEATEPAERHAHRDLGGDTCLHRRRPHVRGSRETNAEDLYFVIMVHGQRSDAEALWGGGVLVADGFASIGGQDSADQHRRWVRFLVWRIQRRCKRGHQAGKHCGYTYASKKSLDSIIDKLRRFTRRASIAHSPTCCAGSTTWPEVGAATFGPGGEARCGTCGSLGANIVERVRRRPVNWAIRPAAFLPRAC